MGRGKHTMQDALTALPEPTMQCPVARVLGPRGQHLHEVVVARTLVADDINQRLNPEDKAWFTTLAQLPPKFRSVVWVKRGGYVLVDLSEQLTDKIGGDIAIVLMAGQVKHLKQAGQWPSDYDAIWSDMLGSSSTQPPDSHLGNNNSDQGSESDSSSSSSDGQISRENPNRRHVEESSTSEEDSDNE
ncbi:hypothetical protein GGI25_001524 [Coemansia spiralis]|uniref:S1-like domain-containing protein n=2 Tax=Coemansia TaxID=4863 RepID=A0A9W8KZX7_9FUNG|nr:hypothetical protein BX070DRAFT_22572 [Coemansia spiralis]KAJ1993634.1 hypothetical protein EDC05_002027 [Coemansia umbellata]KAJ2622999.1 hypothetical protein GGI26_002800 [Coemansia sp. RSA 1358]KAJ2679389.1 hypothetical protein GGI25_001524 [Coemansia spiralis]